MGREVEGEEWEEEEEGDGEEEEEEELLWKKRNGEGVGEEKN